MIDSKPNKFKEISEQAALKPILLSNNKRLHDSTQDRYSIMSRMTQGSSLSSPDRPKVIMLICANQTIFLLISFLRYSKFMKLVSNFIYETIQEHQGICFGILLFCCLIWIIWRNYSKFQTNLDYQSVNEVGEVQEIIITDNSSENSNGTQVHQLLDGEIELHPVSQTKQEFTQQ
ncbi:hypothetical protein HK096_008365, partial [Nowakowskiella sp. JEL0078]